VHGFLPGPECFPAARANMRACRDREAETAQDRTCCHTHQRSSQGLSGSPRPPAPALPAFNASAHLESASDRHASTSLTGVLSVCRSFRSDWCLQNKTYIAWDLCLQQKAWYCTELPRWSGAESCTHLKKTPGPRCLGGIAVRVQPHHTCTARTQGSQRVLHKLAPCT
jgi:hypothetical protein